MNEARELPKEEQIKMTVEEAGKKYPNCAIIFTNADDMTGDPSTDYGIPRVIGELMPDCARHPSMEIYRNSYEYGEIYYCLLFVNPNTIPSILLAKG